LNPGNLARATTSPGLSSAEVAERVRHGQVNRLPRSDWRDYRSILSRNLFTLFNALVVPAAIALFLLKEYRGAWSVSSLAVINAAIGLVQELRAKRHLDRLALVTQTRVPAIRDGAVCRVPANDVVQDDHMLLAAGESVVADGTVLTAQYLEVDEALLTGESDPVPRRPGDRLLAGSFCVAGEGAYRAQHVGSAALAQQTAAQARRYHHTSSPLQQTIDRLIRALTAIAVSLCALYVGLYFLHDFSETELVQMVAATVTSMVPQGLVLMTTLAFTFGAVRLYTRGAVVQRLSAIESMAAVRVLCLDKTGTLTTNRLRLDHVRPLDEAVGEDQVRQQLRLFAALSTDHQSRSIQALRAALGNLPVADPVELVDQAPFKSQNRYSAVRVRAGGAEQTFVLGAWEALRPFLASPADQGEKVWKELLPSGLRLLLFAQAGNDAPAGPLALGLSSSLVLRSLALVALGDEPRPDAGAVLQALAAQGISVMILSGDHTETVRATIDRLELPMACQMLSGEELAAASDPSKLLQTHNVIGRATPQQKVEIVATLQRQGCRVAMVGDGVNDILAIKRADLGIAMGQGSAAARTVAGLVLENNAFELLPATLEEGRIILRNLRRSAKLFLAKNVYALFLIVASLALFGLDFPYLPQQVTLLNALTIGIPALAITLDRTRPTAASRPGFLREVGWFAVSTGLVVGVAGLTIFLLAARWRGDDIRMQRTLVLSTLVLLGIGTLWRVLRDGEAEGRKNLSGLVLLAVPVYLATMYWPAAGDFFQLVPLTLPDWGLVLAVALPAFALCKGIDWGFASR
jgi:cation-transporting ATPase E